MKITKDYLKQIIKEEYSLMLLEQNISLEEEVLEEKLNWKSIGAGLFMAANLFSSPASAYGHAKNKEQAIEFANENPGKVFDYTEIKSDGTKVTYAIARGEGSSNDVGNVTSENFYTGLAKQYKLKQTFDLMLINDENKIAELLQKYLKRYEKFTPESYKLMLKNNRQNQFLASLESIGVENTLKDYVEELKKDTGERHDEFTSGGFKLLEKFVEADLNGQKIDFNNWSINDY